jgi:hypothetical protein
MFVGDGEINTQGLIQTITLSIKMKRNRSLNKTNGLLAEMDVRLSNYMFRPAFVAIVRLQSSSVMSYTVCLKVG